MWLSTEKVESARQQACVGSGALSAFPCSSTHVVQPSGPTGLMEMHFLQLRFEQNCQARPFEEEKDFTRLQYCILLFLEILSVLTIQLSSSEHNCTQCEL